MNLKICVWGLVICCTLFLFGCSPVYRTNYTFTPPEDSEGRTCIWQCENSKLQCQQLEEMRYQACEARAERDYLNCENRKRYRVNKDGELECYQNCYCWRASCSRSYESCEQQYRLCYVNCGGDVYGQTVCIANCDKAPADVPRQAGQ